MSQPAFAAPPGIPLQELVPDLGVTGTLGVNSIEQQGARCAIAVTIKAPAALAELDRMARAKGNMGSWQHRLFWVGPTRLRPSPKGKEILLTSRARYENWIEIDVLFDKIKNKNFQDTKTVDFRLGLDWDGENDVLDVTYEIQNIRSFPGALEDALKGLGVDFGGSSRLALPPSDISARLEPALADGPVFSATPDNKGLQIDAVITAKLPSFLLVDSCIALGSRLESDPAQFAAFATSIIEGF